MNVTKWKDVWRRFSGRGIYPHELAVMLLFPLRRIILSPEKLVRAQQRLNSINGADAL